MVVVINRIEYRQVACCAVGWPYRAAAICAGYYRGGTAVCDVEQGCPGVQNVRSVVEQGCP